MSESDENISTEDDRFPRERVVTRHEIQLDGELIAYQSSAEWIRLRKIHAPIGHIFCTAYLYENDSTDERPITLVFNGGPGAASAYLHMGALGPKRIQFGPNGSLPIGPTRIVDNLETWLPFTDLVFIDPIGTGFSRSLKEVQKCNQAPKPDSPAKDQSNENPEFWEIERDLDSLGEFICRYLSKYHRWTSPICIAGESYGGFRVAKMARRLQEKHGVGLCGALMISPAIELEALSGSDYDLTYWIELFPSLVATAHQHGKTRNIDTGASLNDVLHLGEEFAQNELCRWLAHGTSMESQERNEIVKRMSELCGLSEALIEKLDGRVHAKTFCRELLRDQRLFCGKYDAAIATTDPFPDRDQYDGPDPLWSTDRLFTGAVNHHLRSTLQVDTELDYRLLSHEVHKAWKDGAEQKHFFNKVAGAMDDLRYGMSLNPHMHIFVCHGYFDLVTPYFSTGRLIELMKLTTAQREKIVSRNYLGGHMFYSWDESRISFHNEVHAFFGNACHLS